ncbi:ABC transporter transmembrane domain-containing protein [Marinibaculum pumilum]|uniref:ABC transporter transmembrane domain-containing protein n=1 Tax=Marinibaculum pumilum TaxID=1766165 RepID=A0ABV7KY99_9PROT
MSDKGGDQAAPEESGSTGEAGSRTPPPARSERLEPGIYRFILRYSLRDQIILTALAGLSFIPYYYFLNLPKLIVNQGIQGQSDGQPIDFPVNILGWATLDQVQYLLMLCLAFVGLVIVQQGFKYVINVYQGISGERMLRRLRYQLYTRILRFPLPTFRRMSQGEIIPIVTQEVEPLGGFIAEAIALPVFQGGMLLTSFIFLMVQNPIMGLAGVALYPLQFWIIPKLQRHVNRLAKERVRNVRRIADRVGETIGGINEAHAHDGAMRLRADFTQYLGKNYWIRFEIYQRKFVIKFINNFMQQLGPFFFYAIGGYLTIKGQMDVGTVIAAVAAQKDMGGPLKELLNFYQRSEDARIKYEQVIAQFEPDGLTSERRQTEEPETIPELKGDIVLRNLTYNDEQDQPILESVSATLPMPSKVALVGGSGRDEMLQVIANLLVPHRGSVSIAGHDLSDLTEAVTGRRIGYVGPVSYIFNDTIAGNMFYGLRHRPLHVVERDSDAESEWHRELREAVASGNSTDDLGADWTDYAAAGAKDPSELQAIAIGVLRMVELEEDVYQFGLRSSADTSAMPDLEPALLEARAKLRERLQAAGYDDLVEAWDPDGYNTNATVAENLLFGAPVTDGFKLDDIGQDPFVLQVLEEVGLRDRFLTAGYEIAATMVELFADLPADHEFFQQFSFISAEDLPDFGKIVSRVSVERLDQLSDAERQMLMNLPFKMIPARHRLGQITEEIQGKILEARKRFAEELPEERRGAIAFFDPDGFTRGASILDNILFGKIAYGQAQAAERVGELITQVVAEADLRDQVTGVGMNMPVGIGGGRLSASQRQRLAVARAVIKRPDLLLLSEPMSALDAGQEERIMGNLFETFGDHGIVWALQRPEQAAKFDHILLIQSGRIVAQGSTEEMQAEDSAFQRYLADR